MAEIDIETIAKARKLTRAILKWATKVEGASGIMFMSGGGGEDKIHRSFPPGPFDTDESAEVLEQALELDKELEVVMAKNGILNFGAEV